MCPGLFLNIEEAQAKSKKDEGVDPYARSYVGLGLSLNFKEAPGLKKEVMCARVYS